jgi:hypothetical protein
MNTPCDWCAAHGWVPSDEDGFTPIDCPRCHGRGYVGSFPLRLTPVWDSFAKIATYRQAIELGFSRGSVAAEERAIAIGNLDEAAAKLRLQAAS